MGLQKTIYIPDRETWESIQKAAAGQNRSVSAYLVGLHQACRYTSIGGSSEKVIPIKKRVHTPEHVYARPVDVEGTDSKTISGLIPRISKQARRRRDE